MDRNLERRFEELLISLYRRTLYECGYNATRFLQMLREHGGLQTAKILLHSPGFQYGSEKLWELKRLDLTVEAHILKPPWDAMFTDEEKEIARKRLTDCGYTPD
jgi:hypothetical protein